jgi:GNAT superfamily N-acetyltransferase
MVPVDDCGSFDAARAVLIRALRDSDVPLVGQLVRRLLPTMVVSDAEIEHMRHSTAWWVAEDDGDVLGVARAGRMGRAWVGVVDDARRRGFGTALLDVAERHLHATAQRYATGWTDDDAGASFCAARGYRPTRRKHVAVLRLDEVDTPPPKPPPDVALHPLAELGRRVEELYDVAMAAYADEPADIPAASAPLEEWVRDDLGVPDLSAEGSVFATVNGEIAAFSLVTVDEAGRAENEFTGTRPAFRQRGLAMLCKLAVIDWARRHGVREIWTGNDAENAPMLAINRRLGYRVVHERVQHMRAL